MLPRSMLHAPGSICFAILHSAFCVHHFPAARLTGRFCSRPPCRISSPAWAA